MNTNGFNLLDRIVANWRLSKVVKNIKRDEVILDFGCGSQGYFLRQVSPIIKSGFGLDYDVENKKIDNLEFKKFIFKDKLPFENDNFDKVVMLAVLEHIDLDKVKKLFDEFDRVLKKKGEIILTTPTVLSKPVLEFLATAGILNKGEIMDHKKYYKKGDIENLAKDVGLRVIDYKLFQLGLNSYVVLAKK